MSESEIFYAKLQSLSFSYRNQRARLNDI